MLPSGVTLHTPGGFVPNARDIATLAVLILVMTVCAGQLALAVARRRGSADATVAPAVWLGWLAAACSIGAGIIHLAVIQDHLTRYLPFGLAFLLLAFFQLAWPPIHLMRPTRRSAMAAIAINLGAMGIWLWSRTVGLPIGPEAGLGVPEAIGLADSMATLLEAGLIVALLVALQRPDPAEPTTRLGLTQAVLLVSSLSGLVAFATLVSLFGLSGPI